MTRRNTSRITEFGRNELRFGRTAIAGPLESQAVSYTAIRKASNRLLVVRSMARMPSGTIIKISDPGLD